MGEPLPQLFEPLREPMVKSFETRFSDIFATLEEFDEREGDCDYCTVFCFQTEYAPSKLRQQLLCLSRPANGTNSLETQEATRHCSDCSTEATDIASMARMEGALPVTMGLEGLAKVEEDKWIADLDMLPDDCQGLPLCRGMQVKAEQMAREVVAAAVARAMPTVLYARRAAWLDIDTDLDSDQRETMLPLSQGMPQQEVRVASQVVAGAVARALARKTRTVPSPSEPSEHDKWRVMENELADFCSECPICFEEINRPVVLPCQHAFCADCLLRAITQFKETSCPLCRGALCSEDGLDHHSDLSDGEIEWDDDQYGSNFPSDHSAVANAAFAIYMIPVALYSLPILAYLSPYLAYRSCRSMIRRRAMTQIDASLDGAEVDAASESFEQAASSSEPAPASRAPLPRTSLIPPLR
jgi:hypothetical protein